MVGNMDVKGMRVLFIFIYSFIYLLIYTEQLTIITPFVSKRLNALEDERQMTIQVGMLKL